MQIKFLTIYGSSIHGTSAVDAQCKLLEFWHQSIVDSLVKPIQKAIVEFKDYSFSDYYNQEKLTNEIKKSLPSGYNHQHNKQYSSQRQ